MARRKSINIYIQYFEIFYGGQKLHKYFRSLLIKDTSLLTCCVSISANCVTTGNLNARINPSSYLFQFFKGFVSDLKF